MTAPELKPCPFCGSGIAQAIGNASFSGVELMMADTDRPYVWCGTCGSAGSFEDSNEKAIAAWNTRAPDPDLEAHIGAVLADAAELVVRRGKVVVGMDRHQAASHAYAILALRPTALTALDRAKREGRVEGMERLPKYLVSFEKDNSFRLGQVQGFIYGDDCVVRDCWLPAGEQEVLRKPASEISHDEMMDFIHAYRLRLAIRALIEKEGKT